MTRKHAVSQLYSQHRTERDFGWYDGDAEWRRQLREIYPVAYVAAHHRLDVTPSMMNDHARRLMSFNRRLTACSVNNEPEEAEEPSEATS